MNYKQSEITGSEYTRCSRVIANNPLDNPGSVEFHEETVIVAGERRIVAPAGELRTHFWPGRVIELINPETLEPTGQTMTYGEIYVALFSAYMDAARQRDEAAAPVGETVDPI